MEHIFMFKMNIVGSKPSDGGAFFSKDNLPESRRLEPYLAGKGPLNYRCGHCDHLLLRSIRKIQVTDAVYKCPKCGSFNRIKL